MNTDLQAALTQALLSHEKVWADEEKTILAKKYPIGFGGKNRPDYYWLAIGK